MSASNSPRLLFEAASVTVRGRRFVPLISPEEINRAVERVAAAIVASHVVDPLFLCVLKGGAFFLTDLVRRIPLPATIAFVRSTSYGEGMRSSGEPTFTEDAGTHIEGRDVIIVEDIVDTGVTVTRLRERLREQGAASVRTAAFLYKPHGAGGAERPDYCGFDIPDRFVIGYGLDYAEEGRHLPGVYVLEGRIDGEEGGDNENDEQTTA
jgi:hypoxanthine phosphoribosyltransferase